MLKREQPGYLKEGMSQPYKIHEPTFHTCKYKMFENIDFLHCEMILMKSMVRTPSAIRFMIESAVADTSCISL